MPKSRGGKLLDLFMALCLLFAAVMLVMTAKQLSTVPTGQTPAEPCLVIDPGHGGLDGGAIAFNGLKESDVNLAIGLKLRSLADFLGFKTTMTREDDNSSTDYANYSEHEELVRRTEQINRIPNAVLISIHQNFFPTSQPSGAEILYAPGEKSRQFGEITQKNIVSLLQSGNRRVAGPAPKSLYITSHITCPGILAECGFLSNLTDLDLLSQDSYQTSVAAVLLLSYVQFLSNDTHT